MSELTIKKFLKETGYKSTSIVSKKDKSGVSFKKTLKTTLKEFCAYIEANGGVQTKEFKDLVERVPGRFLNHKESGK